MGYVTAAVLRLPWSRLVLASGRNSWSHVCWCSLLSVGGRISLQKETETEVAQSCPTLRPHELQHARPPCPSPTPGAHQNPWPLSRWCHPTISSSVLPFSSCPQSFPASGSFPVSQLFASGGQSIGASASASVLPVNTQDWSPLGWTGWISLQSLGLLQILEAVTEG